MIRMNDTKPIAELRRYEYSLLAEVESLHMAITGASEPATADSAARAGLIKQRLADWQPSNGTPWHAYDEAVKALCVAALTEWEGSWLQKDEAVLAAGQVA